MSNLDIHMQKIEDTQRQIRIATSPQRRRDLSKYLHRLCNELHQYKRYANETTTSVRASGLQ